MYTQADVDAARAEERERCRKIANERTHDLLAAINLDFDMEWRRDCFVKMLESILIEQRIEQDGYSPKEDAVVDIKALLESLRKEMKE
jgi:hypothetical protein